MKRYERIQESLHLGNNTTLGCLDKLHEIAYFRAIGHLLFHLEHRVEHACLPVEHQSIGVSDVFNVLRVYAIGFQHHGVYPAISQRFTAKYDVRRHVFRERCACLNHGAVTNSSLGVLNNARREYHAVANYAVAGNLSAVAEHAIVAYLRVMRNVRAFHQEVVIADNGFATLVRSAVDNHVFADGVVVADDEERPFAHEIEVLGQRSQHRTLINTVSTAHACAVKYAYEGVDNAVVAYLHIVFYVDEG